MGTIRHDAFENADATRPPGGSEADSARLDDAAGAVLLASRCEGMGDLDAALLASSSPTGGEEGRCAAAIVSERCPDDPRAVGAARAFLRAHRAGRANLEERREATRALCAFEERVGDPLLAADHTVEAAMAGDPLRRGLVTIANASEARDRDGALAAIGTLDRLRLMPGIAVAGEEQAVRDAIDVAEVMIILGSPLKGEAPWRNWCRRALTEGRLAERALAVQAVPPGFDVARAGEMMRALAGATI